MKIRTLFVAAAAALMTVGGVTITNTAGAAEAPMTRQEGGKECYPDQYRMKWKWSKTLPTYEYEYKRKTFRDEYKYKQFVPGQDEVVGYRWSKEIPGVEAEKEFRWEIQERTKHDEWKWLREHKDIQVPNGGSSATAIINWLDEIGVPNAQPGQWYALPQSVIDSAGFDPRSVSPTGTVSMSVYGGPNITVNYQFVIEGPSDWTTGSSPYGGGVKVETHTVYGDWTDAGYTDWGSNPNPPADSDTKRYVNKQEQVKPGTGIPPQTLWHPSEDGFTVDPPEGDGWSQVDSKVLQEAIPASWKYSGWVTEQLDAPWVLIKTRQVFDGWKKEWFASDPGSPWKATGKKEESGSYTIYKWSFDKPGHGWTKTDVSKSILVKKAKPCAVTPPIVTEPLCGVAGKVTAENTKAYTWQVSGPQSARVYTAIPNDGYKLNEPTSFGPFNIAKVPYDDEGCAVTIEHGYECASYQIRIEVGDKVPGNWNYGVGIKHDGQYDNSVVQTGPGSVPYGRTLTEDQSAGDVEVSYYVVASTEQDLLPADLKPVDPTGENAATRSFVVDTDCSDNPEPDVEYTEWVDGEWECQDTTVTQTREKWTIPYKLIEDEQGPRWVPDPDNKIIEVEEQVRELSEEEIFDCEIDASVTAGYDCVAEEITYAVHSDDEANFTVTNVSAVPGTLTVELTAKDGYTFPDGKVVTRSAEYTVDGDCEVTPLAPEVTPPTCAAPGSVNAPDTPHYTWTVTDGIYTAVAAEGVRLVGETSFGPFDLAQLTGEQCEEKVDPCQYDPKIPANDPKCVKPEEGTTTTTTPPKPLPATGSDTAAKGTVLGLSALFIGMVLVGLTRRRRTVSAGEG